MSPNNHTSRVSDPSLKYELWVVLLLCCILSITEFGLRSAEANLSGNLRHVNQIPDIASKLNADTPAVLFLGNSLTNNAIDLQAFNRPYSILHGAAPRSVEKITPDGTSLSDWFCIYRNFIGTQQNPPKVVIVGFAWAQLSDQYPVNSARLGGLFCSLGDVPELAHTGLARYENILTFTVGAVSHVYLNREAIRNRALDLLIPSYRDVSQAINAESNQGGDDSAAIPGSRHYTYATFRRFSELVTRAGTRLVIMAMPVQNAYEVDPTFLTVIERYDVTLIDLRHMPGLDASQFKDPIHLNALGRKIFSRTLAEILDAQTVSRSD